MNILKIKWNDFVKQMNLCNKELSKAIGKKSVYGNINIDYDLMHHQWIDFNFSQKLTKEEEKQVKRILTKYLGKLDRPDFVQRFKTEKHKDGSLRYNTYCFFSYLKGLKKIK